MSKKEGLPSKGGMGKREGTGSACGSELGGLEVAAY